MIAATNYAAIIRPLQFLVLALAALFFLRVLRAAMLEMQPPGDDGERRTRRRRRLSLEFIEPEALAGERIEVVDAVTLGRGAPSNIVLDDSFLSTVHARLSLDGDDLFVEDLGSTNGSYVNAEPLIYRTQLIKGDVVQLGNTIFEVVR